MVSSSFNELLIRIPKGKGTDKVKVILALYCLEGQQRTVTTAEVRDYLKLHLRKAAPTNMSDVLLKAAPYVEAAKADDGRRAWRLTRSGIEFLQELLGDQVMPGTQVLPLNFNDLHPEVQRAAEDLLRGGHHCEAVGRAAKALNLMIRRKTGRTRDDGVSMMHQVFAASPNDAARLQVNDLKEAWQRDEQEGIRFMMAGVQAAITNVDKHGDLGISDPVQAMELLAAISLLARIVDRSRRLDP